MNSTASISITGAFSERKCIVSVSTTLRIHFCNGCDGQIVGECLLCGDGPVPLDCVHRGSYTDPVAPDHIDGDHLDVDLVDDTTSSRSRYDSCCCFDFSYISRLHFSAVLCWSVLDDGAHPIVDRDGYEIADRLSFHGEQQVNHNTNCCAFFDRTTSGRPPPSIGYRISSH